MYRTLAEAAQNCTQNISKGFGPLFSDHRYLALNPSHSADDPQISLLRERLTMLSSAMKDKDCATRVRAVCALAELGPHAKDAVPELIELIDDRDWVVRMGAITALGEIGAHAREAVPVLIEQIEKDDVCTSAVIALGRIGSSASAATEALQRLLKKECGFTRWCAEEALRGING